VRLRPDDDGRDMDAKDVLDELKTLFVTRLKFDPRRVAEVGLDTPLPKGVEGAVGLDSLDFIELGIAIEDRFGVLIDESQDVGAHFASFGALCRFVAERAARG
jgi:acyl carrier protein